MKGEWCYDNKAFSPKECKKILNIGLRLPVENAKMGATGNTFVTDYRKSKIRFIQKEDQNFDFLFDRMWKLALQANEYWFDFHITKISYIQLAEYDSDYQGEYKRHHDVFWMNNDARYHRKLTAVVQLSDPTTYEGGDLELFSDVRIPNGVIKPQGTTVFFPSFIEHQAHPVTKGTRYSLACWFDGPKWR